MGSPLKERVDRQAARRLADAIAAVDTSFDAAAFVAEASASLHSLELKARVEQLAATLERHLAGPFGRAAQVLCAAASGAALDMWAAWPCVTYVERCGLDEPETALDALACLTRYASAEFAIRPFLEHHPHRTLTRLTEWADSGDVHLRRLVSEGTRPRLPWARRLVAPQWDPLAVLPLLDRLHDDPELYVRRSVANHLNDLAKDHPTLAVIVARRWLATGGTHGPWVVRHGLRGLIKAGDSDALALVGADPSAAVEVYGLRLPEARVRIGDTLHFSIDAAQPGRSPRSPGDRLRRALPPRERVHIAEGLQAIDADRPARRHHPRASRPLVSSRHDPAVLRRGPPTRNHGERPRRRRDHLPAQGGFSSRFLRRSRRFGITESSASVDSFLPTEFRCSACPVKRFC